MDRYWIDDGYVLVTFDLTAFEQAEIGVDLDGIKCVRIGAQLYNSLPFDTLISRLRRFRNLRTIVLSDDWIQDDQMLTVQSYFESAFPGLVFAWKPEGLVAGKHGR